MNREELRHKYATKLKATTSSTRISQLLLEYERELEKISLPPAEGAEAIVKKYEDEYDFKFHWVQRDRVIRMMREFAAQPQPKLDPKKVQWSGYGELGNISQKPLHPTAEGAGKTCHAKEMEYNHNMCAMQESCEKCEAYKVPTNEGDIAKTETDTGRIVDMPDLSQPTAEGAEEILQKYMDMSMIICPLHVVPRTVALDAMHEFATLHAQRIAEKMVSERDELQVLMNDISEWSDKAFGDGQRNPAIVYHLKKEVNELIEAIEKTNALGSDPSVGVGEFGRQRTVTRVEYADCLMLLLDSAHHFGISAGDLLSVTRGKLEINKVRSWGKPDENGVVEHIEP